MASAAAPGDRRCAACRSAVSAGSFCGFCGSELAGACTGGRKWLRPRVFAAAPREPITLPLITSSLCPHLADTDRVPFRHGLFLALAMLIGVSALKLLPALVVLSALGIPLLFVLYLWRSGIYRDVPKRALLLPPLIGVGLSVTVGLWSANLIADSYGIPLAGGFQLREVLDIGFAVTVADAVLMLVPAVVVRLLRPPSCESLDGFLIGAFGALCYASAGTITWLAPQFTLGLLDNYSRWRLFSEGILYGIFEPLTAAAVGGMAGILLWFRPARRPGQPRGLRAALALCAVLGVGYYVAIYAFAAGYNSRITEAVVNTAITALALLTLRVAIQIAVLHEEPDPATGRPVRCMRCAATVPDMPFCPECGGAARACARSTRLLRRTPAGDGIG